MPVGTLSPNSTSQNDLRWLVLGAYAQYSAIGAMGIWRYNSSLDSANCSLALQDLSFLNSTTIDPLMGEEFIYRWEVIDTNTDNVTLNVDVTITGWENLEFDIVLNLINRMTYAEEKEVGISYLWLISNELDAINVIFSNPVVAFGDISSHLMTVNTIQGVQQAYDISGIELNYIPPEQGSRGQFHTNLGYDESTGLLLTLNGRTILPFPLWYRFITIVGTVELIQTNIDLGPDIITFNPSGLIASVGMIIAIVLLTGIFYMARRRAKQRKRRIKRVKKRKGA
jgi:hypothetical protein